MTALEIIKLIARADFRPMNDYDAAGFAGAPSGTLISEDNNWSDLGEVIILHSPAGEEPEHFEVHGGGECWRLDLDRLF